MNATTLTPRPPTSGASPAPRRRASNRRRSLLPTAIVGWLLLWAVICAAIIWPLVMLFFSALRTGSPLGHSEWTLSGVRHLSDNLLRGNALVNSAILAVITTVFGVGLALALALAERTNAVARVLIRPLVLVSVATSSMFYAMSYSQLANSYTGIINVWVKSATGRGPVINIESWLGLGLVGSLHSSAFVYLFLVGPVSKLNASYEEAAAMSGASRWRTLRTITAPLLTPILLSTVLIGLISGIQSFDAPLILGDPANLNFLGTRMWSLINDHNPPLYAQAGAIAVVLFAALITLSLTQGSILRRHDYVSVTGKSFRAATWDLGRGRYLAGAAILLYATLAVILPFGAVIITSFQPFPGVFQGLSTRNYTQLFANPNVAPAITNTIVISILGGVLATLLALTIALAVPRASHGTRIALRATMILPLAMPGIVAAIAITWAFASVPGLRELYGTIWLMVIAVTVATLPIAVQIVNGSVAQLGSELDEAARMSGAAPVRALATVTIPLLLPSLLATWLLTAILISGNLDAPLILSSQDTQTISTLTYQMFSNQNQGQAAAMLILLVAGLLVTGAIIAALVALITRRRNALSQAPHTISDTEISGGKQ
ncbi:MAG: iron ABC transporter permease [Gordonia sp. (in: high G+C Gram-positive bacteria)]